MKFFFHTFYEALKGNLGRNGQILAWVDVMWVVLVLVLILREAAIKWF